MKRFLILVALGFFLAAHGAVGFMSIYPEPAFPVEIPQAPPAVTPWVPRCRANADYARLRFAARRISDRSEEKTA